MGERENVCEGVRKGVCECCERLMPIEDKLTADKLRMKERESVRVSVYL